MMSASRQSHSRSDRSTAMDGASSRPSLRLTFDSNRKKFLSYEAFVKAIQDTLSVTYPQNITEWADKKKGSDTLEQEMLVDGYREVIDQLELLKSDLRDRGEDFSNQQEKINKAREKISAVNVALNNTRKAFIAEVWLSIDQSGREYIVSQKKVKLEDVRETNPSIV